MKLLIVVLFSLLLNATIFATGQTSEDHGRFQVSLPQHWQESKLRVEVDELQAPGNVPFKLRVFAIGEDGKEVPLGSMGIEAVGRDKTALRTMNTLRLDVTRSLNRFLANKSKPAKVEIIVRPVDARNNPIKDMEWSVKDVRLKAEPK